MLSKNSIQTARAQGESLAQKGLRLTTTHDSVIGALVSACRPMVDVKRQPGESFIEKDLDYAVAVSTGNTMQDSIHDVMLENVVGELVKTVSPHVHHARNVVAPRVAALATAVATRVSEFSPADAISRFSVKKLDIPSIIKDGDFISSIKHYGKDELPPYVTPIPAGLMSLEAVSELIKSGPGEISSDGVKFVLELDPEVAAIAHDTFFNTHGPAAKSPEYLFGLDAFTRLNMATYVHIVALAMEQNPPQDLNGLTLNEFRLNISGIIRWSGTVAAIAYENCVASRRLDTLVIMYQRPESTVVVDGDIYSAFLEEGGSPELLMACLLDQEETRGSKAILEMAKNKEQVWNEYVALNARNQEKESLSYLRNLFGAEYRELLKDVDPSEEEYCQDNGRRIDACCKAADEVLEAATEEQLRDVGSMALNLIGNCRFGFSSAYDILYEIEQTCKAAGVEAREAAGPAILKYVTKFLTSQISAVR